MSFHSYLAGLPRTSVPVDGVVLGEEHPLVAANHDAGRRRSCPGNVFRVTVNHKVGPLGWILALERLAEKRRRHGRIENHRQAIGMRRGTNRRDIQHVTMRVAGRLEEHINLAALFEPVGVVRAHRIQCGLEILCRVAVKKSHTNVEVAGLVIPVVQQLKRPAVHVARTEDDILITDEMTQGGIDGGHSGVEVPGHVLRRQRPALQVDDVIRERDCRGIQQSRVDFQQHFLALEGCVDPFGAGVEIGRGPRDDRRRGEDRGHVVENRVRALRNLPRLRRDERLVNVPEGVLAVCRAASPIGNRGTSWR